MNVVIGFGNPLRGDDGAGPAVADAVRQLCPDARVFTPQQLVPELAEPVAVASRVVFIDAAAGGDTGTVGCTPAAGSTTVRVDHALSPADLLGLARAVFGSSAPAWLVTIHGAAFDFASDLSPAVASAIPRAATLVARILDDPGPPD